MRKIQIGNSAENVVERADFPPERIKAILGSETVAVLGYGVQGRGQSLNMRDNGVNVLIGLRENKGKSIDASYAIHQDATGKALDRCLATGIAIGSGYMFETTFQKEVFSDLTGERGVLMGAIYGLWLAQYEVLREHGHSPSEAFNETVEEATQSLYPLIAENGMDWMYANCSTTAKRGALDWYKRFRDIAKPVFEELYQKVSAGDETRRVLEANSRKDYREQLEKELKAVANSEMWQAGTVVRSLRPERATKTKA